MRSYNIIKSAAIGGILEKMANLPMQRSTKIQRGEAPRLSPGTWNSMSATTPTEELQSAARGILPGSEGSIAQGPPLSAMSDEAKLVRRQPKSLMIPSVPRVSTKIERNEDARTPTPWNPSTNMEGPNWKSNDQIISESRKVPQIYKDRVADRAAGTFTGGAPKAIPVKEEPAPDMNALFRKHHATDFDPKSRVDRMKMQKLIEKMGQ